MENSKWHIDPKDSEISFSVRKLLVTTVKGNFKVFTGDLETESQKFNNLKNLQFQARVDSIKTDDEKRDVHLKSADFFDIDTYLYISFRSTRFNHSESKLEGNLRIKNITKTITLDVEFLEPSGKKDEEERAELSVSGRINRQDFDLSWNGKNEAGEIIVGDEIKLKARATFVKIPTLAEII